MWASYETNIVDYAELVEHCFGKVFFKFKKIIIIFLIRKWEYF